MITGGKLILRRVLPTCRTERMYGPLGRHLSRPLRRVGAHGPYALRARIRSAAEEGKWSTR